MARRRPDACQPDGAAVDQGHAPAPAVDAEDGVACRDAQIAPHRQLEPAGDGVALDRRDDRLREQHAARAHGAVAVHGDAVAAAFRDALQVRPGAERAARAGEHRDGEGVVGVEAPEGVGEQRRRRSVDGVAYPRTVDGDDGDGAVGLEADGAHVRPPRAGGRVGQRRGRRQAYSGGKRSAHGAARSSCAPTRRSRSSRAYGATSCTPSGSPSAVMCIGSEIAGCPDMLKGSVQTP